MLTALGQRLEGISDDRMARILLNFFIAAVIVSLVAWGVGVVEFRRPFLEWVSSLFEWVDSFAQNTGSEMFGAFLTFILLEVVRGSRERKAQEDAEEQRTKATQELVRGFIQAQELARMRAAKTPEERQPILDSMNATGLLEGADLSFSNLQGAWLVGVDLQGVRLFKTNLQGANLAYAKLQGADLRWANMEGAKHLTLEQLRQAESLQGTKLPDGTRLPGRTREGQEPPWRKAFKAWCKTVELETGPLGTFIKPADLPSADPDANE